MDRTNEFARELDQLTKHATDLIGQISDREVLPKDVMNSSGEEIRGAYIREAKELVERIAESRLAKAKKEEATPGAQLMKPLTAALVGIASGKASESQLARDFLEPAIESYRMDETIRKRIKEASAVLKRRIEEEVSAMELGKPPEIAEGRPSPTRVAGQEVQGRTPSKAIGNAPSPFVL